MIVSMNINPEKLEVKVHPHFVILTMANGNRSTEITTLFDPSHIDKLHEIVNALYEIRANGDRNIPQIRPENI
ncbi:hypothetical protein [Synechococcus sp. PCC 7502]|uniref:hypothetical protein n=1 Tax=Synechococcus sp. PCC 7502 TaxID=1173263 RepID=UPI00118183FD|nr:hypothetical protein [Synechococcus sp. PCC 7502]